MSLRSEEVQTAYEIFKRTYTGICPFCDAKERNKTRIIEECDTMRVLRNNFPYSRWDTFEVSDHLMIVPLRHIGSFNEFNKDEIADFFELLRKYESNHYSVYSRAPTNPARTQLHLHVHLIRPVGY